MSSNGHDEQEGFLARWSRLKARSVRGEELPDPEARAAEDEVGEESFLLVVAVTAHQSVVSDQFLRLRFLRSCGSK